MSPIAAAKLLGLLMGEPKVADPQRHSTKGIGVEFGEMLEVLEMLEMFEGACFLWARFFLEDFQIHFCVTGVRYHLPLYTVLPNREMPLGTSEMLRLKPCSCVLWDISGHQGFAPTNQWSWEMMQRTLTTRTFQFGRISPDLNQSHGGTLALFKLMY